MYWRHAIAWPVLIIVWIATPFIGGYTPPFWSTCYWVYLVAAVVFGLVTAWKKRSIFLALASVLTAGAWPIALCFALYMGGI